MEYLIQNQSQSCDQIQIQIHSHNHYFKWFSTWIYYENGWKYFAQRQTQIAFLFIKAMNFEEIIKIIEK